MIQRDWKALRQQTTNTLFCEMLNEAVAEWCDRHRLEPTIDVVVAYMVKHNIVRQSIINRYVVIHKYRDYFDKEGGKEKAVFALSNTVPLEPKGIYSILGNHAGYFRPNRFKYP